jgi:hypothetical protein
MRRIQAIALLILLLGLPAGASVGADGPNRVGLVVQFGDGSVISRCVEFSEPSLSGYEVLARAGLTVVAEFSGLGAAVCKVQNDGCDYPAETCFCQCEGSPCTYWVYHHLVDGAWQYSGFGAGSYQVSDGAVEGWAWGQGDPNGGVQPPVMTFEQICAPPPTATPNPPTATPVPPTATAVPTAVPTATPASTPEPVVWFRVDQNPIAAGACTTLRWDTSGVESVTLDGQAVAPNGSRQVCPTAPQRYHLRVATLGGAAQSYPLDLGVTGTAPTAAPSATPPADATVAPPRPTATGGPASMAPAEGTATPDVIAEETSVVLAGAPPAPTATSLPATHEVIVIAAPTLPPTVVPTAAPTATPAEAAAAPAAPPSGDLVGPAAEAGTAGEGGVREAVPDRGPYLLFGGLVVLLLGALLLVAWRQRTA